MYSWEGERDSVRGFLRSRSASREREAAGGRWRLAAVAFLVGVVFLPMLRTIGGVALGAQSQAAMKATEESGGMQQKRAVDTAGWEAAPRVDLVCRTYGGSLHIMWNTFLPSYLLFWPIMRWKSSGLVVILDGDSDFDHQQGTVLENLTFASRVKVKYEAPAPEGTLCANWRREGYARQQYSNFYADLYSDAEFVAIIDTDAAFRAPVVPSDLFEDGKPIVVGFNQMSEWKSDLTARAVGGHEGIGRFMTRYSFPVVLKSSHLAEMRAGIAKNLAVETFEEAFNTICSRGPGSYSQFDIMMNYLWYNLNDEYAWHIADPLSGQFEEISGHNRPRATDDPAVLSKDIPTILPMRHMGKAIDTGSIGPRALFKNLCFGSNYKAGYCTSQEPSERAGVPITGWWTVGDRTWADTYEDHLHQVAGAHQWHTEAPEDWVYPGSK